MLHRPCRRETRSKPFPPTLHAGELPKHKIRRLPTRTSLVQSRRICKSQHRPALRIHCQLTSGANWNISPKKLHPPEETAEIEESLAQGQGKWPGQIDGSNYRLRAKKLMTGKNMQQACILHLRHDAAWSQNGHERPFRVQF
eukprot:s5768_g4.t1